MQWPQVADALPRQGQQTWDLHRNGALAPLPGRGDSFSIMMGRPQFDLVNVFPKNALASAASSAATWWLIGYS